MKTLYQNGILVSQGASVKGDVLVEDGRIVMVDEVIDIRHADRVIEVSGRHVLPGFIDTHVHSRDPGLTHKETFFHATRAAAAGGITTILDMPNTRPPIVDPASVAARVDYLTPKAHVDFGLWGLVFGNESPADIQSLKQSGVTAVKLFWGYAFDRTSGTLVYDDGLSKPESLIEPADNGAVWSLIRAVEKADLVLAVHCEDRRVNEVARDSLGAINDYEDLRVSRPACSETAAVATLIELTYGTSARVHVVHVSSGRSVKCIAEAQQSGIDISAETCPHYLTLPDLLPKDTTRADAKVYPPIRGKFDAADLWAGVASGAIGLLASDHAPHARSDYEGPFSEAPAGILGIETMVPILLDQVNRGHLTIERLVACLSEEPARRYGLYPQKGSFDVGSDADFTIVDMEREWTVSNQNLHSLNSLSPWDGVSGVGAPIRAVLRGREIMGDGEPFGPASGRFVRPL